MIPRSTARRGLFPLLVLLFVSSPGWAYSSYGLGQLECQTYLDKRGDDQAKHEVTNTSYIHAYLSGYLTAGNMLHGLVGARAKDVSINIHAMVQWLDAWCLEHRSTRVAVALESFWVEAAGAQEKLRPAAPDNATSRRKKP
jgi:hypothetical protein